MKQKIVDLLKGLLFLPPIPVMVAMWLILIIGSEYIPENVQTLPEFLASFTFILLFIGGWLIWPLALILYLHKNFALTSRKMVRFVFVSNLAVLVLIGVAATTDYLLPTYSPPEIWHQIWKILTLPIIVLAFFPRFLATKMLDEAEEKFLSLQRASFFTFMLIFTMPMIYIFIPGRLKKLDEWLVSKGSKTLFPA
ncbi:hypothetical protein [Emcibacter nanhaiensis]|uniref:Uncharacterized protein n=1 Tax=Emcibacter nanhaiensis TaxID=1505037 RepID=A0A501PD07_9PROT|nr:hypothetical protein [Emcibacter nanhaiensis]TPD57846.1 hypothetical protein FIV46_17255 [Emcibacter nanhaiensis]